MASQERRKLCFWCLASALTLAALVYAGAATHVLL